MSPCRNSLAETPAHEVALECLEAGIEGAHPGRIVDEKVALDGDRLTVDDAAYDLSAYRGVIVLGGGNAAGTVAAGLEDELGDRIANGTVMTDVPVETSAIEVAEGDHPVPSERGMEGAARVLELAESATEETLILGVVTGGGSALLPAPAGDLSLGDVRWVTDELLACGATIGEINAVRKHLSALKGGRLAEAAAPARVVGLVFSDVVGNDLDVVASGPLTPDSSTYREALDVVNRYDLDVPTTVRERLERGVAADIAETPGTDDPAFERVDVHVLADSFTALEAARAEAVERGYDAHVLSSRIRGEAREAAKSHVAVAEEMLATRNPFEPPAVVLSGGETTVTLRGDGDGGPNQEFALSAALELDDPGVVVASADTDGIDGASDAAGAIVDADTVADDLAAARDALARNDAYAFLAARDALIETGPTGTNVNDLRVMVVESDSTTAR
jgi:hydroxypyruvate reductase